MLWLFHARPAAKPAGGRRVAVTPEVARRLAHDLDVEEARLDREQPG